jgi:hypothetical protein
LLFFTLKEMSAIKFVNGLSHAALGGAVTGWILAGRPFTGAGIAAASSVVVSVSDKPISAGLDNLTRRFISVADKMISRVRLPKTRPNTAPNNNPSGTTLG